MGVDTFGFAPLNLLAVVLVFRLALLIPWSKLWQKPDVAGATAKVPRPLKPKTGADCPDCQVEHGDHVQVDERGVVIPSRFGGKGATPVEARRPV